MSDDRLEKALEAIKNEEAEPNQLADAKVRVWAQLQTPASTACAEFQSEIRDYLDGKLGDQRRLLMEDHLSRCPSCRTRMAEEKGERRPIPIQSRRKVRMPKWVSWAAAAALLISMLYVGRNSIYEFFTQNSPRATVVSADGGLYLVPNGLLKSGSTIGEGQVVRTSPGAKARLRLSDGSQMDMNEGTELFLHAALSEKTIHLQRGDIIVHAAKQRLSRSACSNPRFDRNGERNHICRFQRHRRHCRFRGRRFGCGQSSRKRSLVKPGRTDSVKSSLGKLRSKRHFVES